MNNQRAKKLEMRVSKLNLYAKLVAVPLKIVVTIGKIIYQESNMLPQDLEVAYSTMVLPVISFARNFKISVH